MLRSDNQNNKKEEGAESCQNQNKTKQTFESNKTKHKQNHGQF